MIKKPLKEELLKNTHRVSVKSYERGEDKNYTVVFADGETEVFDEEEFYKYDLYDTESETDLTIGELAYKVDTGRCYLLGVSLLIGSLKPSGYVSMMMRDAGFSSDFIEEALPRLCEEEYLNDERYASKYVLKKTEAKNTSLKMIRIELVSKGVPEDVAAFAVNNSNTDDFEIAKAIVEKKRKAGDDDKKIMRYLAGKGFETSVIIRVVNGRED